MSLSVPQSIIKPTVNILTATTTVSNPLQLTIDFPSVHKSPSASCTLIINTSSSGAAKRIKNKYQLFQFFNYCKFPFRSLRVSPEHFVFLVIKLKFYFRKKSLKLKISTFLFLQPEPAYAST